MYLHMLVDICPGLFANICLDPSNIHASAHSSHLGFPLLVNELRIYRQLDISRFLHRSVKCRPSHTSHRQVPYRDNNFVTWFLKSSNLTHTCEWSLFHNHISNVPNFYVQTECAYTKKWNPSAKVAKGPTHEK